MRGSGALRTVVVAAAGAGLVLWAPHAATVAVPVAASPTGAAQPAAVVRSSPASPTQVPVTAAELTCPGLGASGTSGTPRTSGASGTSGTRSTVLAATPPAGALPHGAGGATGGVSLGPVGSSAAQVRLKRRGAVWSEAVAGASVVRASGSLAAGVVAAERIRLTGQARAEIGMTCGRAATSSWLVGGGAQAGRSERVLLVNPGAVAASVDVTVLGTKGPVSSANGHGIVVAPRSRRVVALDGIAGSEPGPVVHVRSFGSGVAAVLIDGWLDGLVPRGADATGPTAAPAREQVVPGVTIDGAASVRIAAPGPDAASVQVRVLTSAGPKAVPSNARFRLAGGATRDLDLSALPPGAYAVQVRSTVPVVVGAVVERHDSRTHPSRDTEFAWSAASVPIRDLAGMALGAKGAAPPTASLSLAAVGVPARVTVTTVSRAGTAKSASVQVPADSVAVRPLAGAVSVWVTARTGQVRAAVVATASDAHGPLVTISPLADLPLTTPSVVLRAVGG